MVINTLIVIKIRLIKLTPTKQTIMMGGHQSIIHQKCTHHRWQRCNRWMLQSSVLNVVIRKKKMIISSFNLNNYIKIKEIWKNLSHLISSWISNQLWAAIMTRGHRYQPYTVIDYECFNREFANSPGGSSMVILLKIGTKRTFILSSKNVI